MFSGTRGVFVWPLFFASGWGLFQRRLFHILFWDSEPFGDRELSLGWFYDVNHVCESRQAVCIWANEMHFWYCLEDARGKGSDRQAVGGDAIFRASLSSHLARWGDFALWKVPQLDDINLVMKHPSFLLQSQSNALQSSPPKKDKVFWSCFHTLSTILQMIRYSLADL